MNIVATIIPIFVIIVLGWLARAYGFMQPEFLQQANRLVFYLAIPAMVFRSISKTFLTSQFDGEERTVTGFRVVPYEIPAGCVATYYPESNGLIPIRHVAERSNTPAYKSVVVRLVPHGGISG